MDAEIEIMIADSLDALDLGEAPEAILRRFPAHAALLAPILTTAGALTDLDVGPSRGVQANARHRFLAAAEELRAAAATDATVPGATTSEVAPPMPTTSDPSTSMPAAPARPSRVSTTPATGEHRPSSSWWSRLPRPILHRPAFAGLAASVLLASTAALYGSTDALPGDALYPVKQALESARLRTTLDHGEREALADAYNARRIREVDALLAAGREAEVGYTGIAERLGEGRWAIGDVVTEVGGETRILGDLGPGELIHVIGHTAGGRVVATTIICLDDLPGWAPGEALP